LLLTAIIIIVMFVILFILLRLWNGWKT